MNGGTTMRMLMTLVFLAACGPGATPDEDGAVEEAMPEMEGMEGRPAEEGDMMARMVEHMQMMQGLNGDSIQGMLQTHRQMVANMIASMNREMRDMAMPADDAWNATVDSLRNDLIVMPEMDTAELESLMPGHRRRVVRLIEMHREMMSGMGRS